jgi:glutamine amidotransferase
MENKKVAVIDYGLGNLLSVQRGLEKIGANPVVTSDIKTVKEATHVILPGVGAFPDAMRELIRLNMVETIRDISAAGTPILGICLGMQVLFEESNEFGPTKGIALISGKIVKIPNHHSKEGSTKIPHIGWSPICSSGLRWGLSPIIKGIKEGAEFYFVHSYMAIPDNPQDKVAICLYCGLDIPAIIQKNNIFACQFHPEKSGEHGLRLLKNFCSL